MDKAVRRLLSDSCLNQGDPLIFNGLNFRSKLPVVPLADQQWIPCGLQHLIVPCMVRDALWLASRADPEADDTLRYSCAPAGPLCWD